MDYYNKKFMPVHDDTKQPEAKKADGTVPHANASMPQPPMPPPQCDASDAVPTMVWNPAVASTDVLPTFVVPPPLPFPAMVNPFVPIANPFVPILPPLVENSDDKDGDHRDEGRRGDDDDDSDEGHRDDGDARTTYGEPDGVFDAPMFPDVEATDVGADWNGLMAIEELERYLREDNHGATSSSSPTAGGEEVAVSAWPRYRLRRKTKPL